MNWNNQRTILIIGIVFLLTILFIFSSQNSDKSYRTTDKVLDTVVERPVTQADWDWRAEIIPVMRKAAHVVIFLTLAALITLLLKGQKRAWLWALVTSGFIGAIDEIHQIFVPGRGASVGDVLIDLVGSLLGIAIIYAVWKLRKHGKTKNITDAKD